MLPRLLGRRLAQRTSPAPWTSPRPVPHQGSCGHRIPPLPPLPPRPGKRPDLLPLLGIDADHRLPRHHMLAGLRGDVPELGIAVRVLLALDRLNGSLQAEPFLAQQVPCRSMLMRWTWLSCRGDMSACWQHRRAPAMSITTWTRGSAHRTRPGSRRERSHRGNEEGYQKPVSISLCGPRINCH
jgi:hypothetical protein